MPLSFSLCLPRPPSFSWVISLSYVCPSLYVCVPPLFVSDSFSREIRDAYLVPLFSTSRGSAELHRAAMALVIESHIHSSCAHHTLINVSRGQMQNKSQGSTCPPGTCPLADVWVWSFHLQSCDWLSDWSADLTECLMGSNIFPEPIIKTQMHLSNLKDNRIKSRQAYFGVRL